MVSNWTKTPNEILEAMPDMNEAELKLTAVLIRLTYGYHKESVKMTYDDMMKAANLSRGGVSNAIDDIGKRGFFRRGNKSTWYVNSLLSRLNDTEEEVYSVDQNSLPSELKSIDESLPSRPNKPIYKESNSKESKKENNIYDPMLEAIQPIRTALNAIIQRQSDAPGFDDSLFIESSEILFGRDATPADVQAFGEWWTTNGWHDDTPVLKNVINNWGDFKAGRCLKKKPSPNGHLNGNGQPKETAEERYARLFPDDVKDVIKR